MDYDSQAFRPGYYMLYDREAEFIFFYLNDNTYLGSISGPDSEYNWKLIEKEQADPIRDNWENGIGGLCDFVPWGTTAPHDWPPQGVWLNWVQQLIPMGEDEIEELKASAKATGNEELLETCKKLKAEARRAKLPHSADEILSVEGIIERDGAVFGYCHPRYCDPAKVYFRRFENRGDAVKWQQGREHNPDGTLADRVKELLSAGQLGDKFKHLIWE